MTLELSSTKSIASVVAAIQANTVTIDMVRRGVQAYFAWNSKTEEPEALVMAIYCAMTEWR